MAGGAETTWVGADAQVVKDSAELYHAEVPVVAAELHLFRWAVTAVEESAFNVVTSFGGA